MKMIKAIILCLVMSFSMSFYSGPTFAGEVSINKADVTTLAAELTGVGARKAQAIVDYRTENGPFSSIEDLQKVKGISSKTIEKNKENITL